MPAIQEQINVMRGSTKGTRHSFASGKGLHFHVRDTAQNGRCCAMEACRAIISAIKESFKARPMLCRNKNLVHILVHT
jgi:hypothetical protein